MFSEQVKVCRDRRGPGSACEGASDEGCEDGKTVLYGGNLIGGGKVGEERLDISFRGKGIAEALGGLEELFAGGLGSEHGRWPV